MAMAIGNWQQVAGCAVCRMAGMDVASGKRQLYQDQERSVRNVKLNRNSQ
jgi:hypothetical protein